MKIYEKLTCKDLGGPCDAEMLGNSFEEIGQESHMHVMEQMNSGDEAHQAAAGKMKNAQPEEQQAMMAAFKKKYDTSPNI